MGIIPKVNNVTSTKVRTSEASTGSKASKTIQVYVPDLELTKFNYSSNSNSNSNSLFLSKLKSKGVHDVFCNSSNNRFRLLIGRAGCGKTFSINQSVLLLRQEGYKVAIAASTNSAAIEINGKTVHKLINCKDEKVDRFMLRNLIETHHYLIIDESFMLSEILLKDLITQCKEFSKLVNPEFYLILCGDPCQIINSSLPFYNWKEFKSYFDIYYLKENYRQDKKTQKDKQWIECLSEIRLGNCENIPQFLDFKGVESLPNYVGGKGLVLFPTRKMVEDYDLSAARHFYLETLNQTLNQTKDKDKHKHKHKSFPILKRYGLPYSDNNKPVILALFKGIKLCVQKQIKCIDESILSKNELLTITEVNVEQEIIHVISHRNDTHYSIDLKTNYSKQVLPYQESKNSPILIGEIDVLPFKFGYASTIHITQGITIKKPDQLYLFLSPTCQYFLGAIYVALSRTQSYKQITIIIDNRDFDRFKSRFLQQVPIKTIQAKYWDSICLVHEESVNIGMIN